MKKTQLIMGMPITIEVVDEINQQDFEAAFNYFEQVDKKYSTYKLDSEISQINNGLPKQKWSSEMKDVLKLCEQTKNETRGYFNIEHNGKLDPSGLVKGWSVNNVAKQLLSKGYTNFYVEAGGDIQVQGNSKDQNGWVIGIRNPFKTDEIIKIVKISNQGIATSGTYIRGQHIYDPFDSDKIIDKVKSLTVIGPNVYEADRFATAAFAMGEQGIHFIESMPDFEGYMIDSNMIATFTRGFKKYETTNA
jgi:thiamine biosynthesis lipoprotein